MNPDRSDVVQAARGKAQRALRTARLSLDDNDPDGAINRAYYAAFYLASAALHLTGENPKTHSGVQDRFWVRFVQEGTFPEEKAKVLRMAFDARHGRTAFRRTFPFGDKSNGTYYDNMELTVYAADDGGDWIVVTVISRYH